jgi:hypothetical protein
MVRRIFCVIVGCCLASLCLAAEEASIEGTWEQAKEDYFDALDEVNQSVLDRLEALDEKARERGDVAKVKRYKAERAAFEEQGEFPPSMDKAEYRKQLKSVQAELRKAYKATQIAYLKERRDDEAEELEAELKRLLDPQARRDDVPRVAATVRVAARPAAKAKPAADRTRWKSITYGTTLTHVKDKQWQDLEPSGEVRLSYKELDCNDEYIELYCIEREYPIRVYAKRMDIFKDGRWQWLGNGSWLATEGAKPGP